MSTIFDIRNLRLPAMSRGTVILGSLAVVLALVGAFVGRGLYQKATTNTVTAYFPEAVALYAGDDVKILGIQVGSIDKIEPGGDKTKVTFHYDKKYKVPADAIAAILNPNLVAARHIQLEPPYKGGPVLADNAVIPLDRTDVPTEWDELRNSTSSILQKLGPTPEQPKGPFGDAVEALADGLAGKGKQINTTLDSLSRTLTALNERRGDFFGVVKSLALFVDALHQHDQQFVALNQNLAIITDNLTSSDRGVANAIQELDNLLPVLRPFLSQNRAVLAHDVNNLADVTTRLVQPDAFDATEHLLHILPGALANALGIYHPANGTVVGMTTQFFGMLFPNPLELICGPIQAGSRAGYQDSAEMCAQYLGPILDAIKFNYPPFSVNFFSTAAVLPKEVSYSEERLRPPPGYKDTTVPGIFVPDGPLSHRNGQHGWITAPGMQGVKVDHITEGLLTPESLGELMGGPDIVPPPSPYETPPGAPNDYDERPAGADPWMGLPKPQYPIAPPPPGPNMNPVAPPPGPAPLPAEAISSTGPGA